MMKEDDGDENEDSLVNVGQFVLSQVLYEGRRLTLTSAQFLL